MLLYSHYGNKWKINLHFVAFLLHIFALIYNVVVYLLHNYYKMLVNHNTPTMSISIMDAPYEDLKKYCSQFLSLIDEYQQMAPDIITEENDTQFFVEAYYQLEHLYRKLQPGQVSKELREQIASICKHVNKMAIAKLDQHQDFERFTNRFQS